MGTASSLQIKRAEPVELFLFLYNKTIAWTISTKIRVCVILQKFKVFLSQIFTVYKTKQTVYCIQSNPKCVIQNFDTKI